MSGLQKEGKYGHEKTSQQSCQQETLVGSLRYSGVWADGGGEKTPTKFIRSKPLLADEKHVKSKGKIIQGDE